LIHNTDIFTISQCKLLRQLLRQKSGSGAIRLKVVRPSGSAEVYTAVFLEVGNSPEDGTAVAARVCDNVTTMWRHQVHSQTVSLRKRLCACVASKWWRHLYTRTPLNSL